MALRLCVRNGESGVSINASPGSSSLPSFSSLLSCNAWSYFSFFLSIFGHVSLVIMYRLCDINVRENYFFYDLNNLNCPYNY